MRSITFNEALKAEAPLQVAGVTNAYCALLAERAGFSALYLSGAGVANACFGLPDLGVITCSDVIEEARRIRSVTSLPLLVDGDAGGSSPLLIERLITGLIQVGASGVHIEDQVAVKRCGHRTGKELVSSAEMEARIRVAADARGSQNFMIMARTDALAPEGIEGALERSRAYVSAGADAVFAEAVRSIEDVRAFTGQLDVPVLVNITEFGQSPMFTRSELASADVGFALYPLSAFRAMSRAAERVYAAIRNDGTQVDLLPEMQTRSELYDVLGYLEAETRVDAFLAGRDDL